MKKGMIEKTKDAFEKAIKLDVPISIPHGRVARRLNSPAIRPPRALPCSRLDT